MSRAFWIMMFAAAMLACGGETGGADASIDGATMDASGDTQACVPYVVFPSDAGPGTCADGPCQHGFTVEPPAGDPYTICTVSCSDVDPCPRGFVCDVPGPGFHEFACFPRCDDAGGCPSPLGCAVSTDACH